MIDIDSISIGLASPDDILDRSHGEVQKPKVVNHRPSGPEWEWGGLFCEKIFGPAEDFKCPCGTYRPHSRKGAACEKCGVEFTKEAVRRERMGHISLAAPVVHTWFFKRRPNRLGHLLGMTSTALEEVIYYEKYVVIQPGSAGRLGLEENQLLSDEEYRKVLYQIRTDNNHLRDEDPNKFIAEIGGEAIEKMVERLDLDRRAQDLRYQAKTETNQERKDRALKRLQTTEAFREASRDGEHSPKRMVMRVLPVIPPKMRPVISLEEDQYATDDLNDLYRRVLIRNNRLQRLIDFKAPEVILRNERRMLQEAVDALFDNGAMSEPVRDSSDQPLKSFSGRLKGKQGRLRQNLLGRRVDYSGRSVIVSGPHLKLHQCGIPIEMAAELFKPFIIRHLMEQDTVTRVKEGKKYVDGMTEDVLDILEEVMQRRPVLLNRAPTLHRLSIQAFEPVLTDGKAIELHPLVCPAYNADFDGDEMAVHVPLGHEAACESMVRMSSTRNLLKPADGAPIAVPTQDMILGLYYMTKAKANQKGEGMRFANMTEVRQAHDQGVVGTHAKISVRDPAGTDDMIDTTVGRVRFNDLLPDGVGFVNEVLSTENVETVIEQVIAAFGFEEAARFLDRLKRLGFGQSTASGVTFSLSDVIVPEEKETFINEASDRAEQIRRNYSLGFVSDEDRYGQIIDLWRETSDKVSKALFNSLKENRKGFNPIFAMADSGARGSEVQIRQLGGMRGLMARPQKSAGEKGGKTLETPILSNFKEGLSVQEYFISAHGARKGLTDTAQRTPDAGYLMRRLVAAVQDVSIVERDCGALGGIEVSAGEGLREDMLEDDSPIADRIQGRVSAGDIYHPDTGQLIVEDAELIDEEKAQRIGQTTISKVEIRSVLTCTSEDGICALCYGQDLTTQRMVEVGEHVGVVAAQAIGEPGTQLTLRTFHRGGVAEDDITGGLPHVENLFEAYEPEDSAVVSEIEGKVALGTQKRGKQEVIVRQDEDRSPRTYMVSPDRLQVDEGDYVEAGNRLSGGQTRPQDILRTRGLRVTERHLMDEVQKVYQQNGVEIEEKHFEIVVREMLDRVKITSPGDTEFLEGDLVRRHELKEVNAELRDKFVVTGSPEQSPRGPEIGETLSLLDAVFHRSGGEHVDGAGISGREARLAVGEPVILGISEVALETESWISAASFQETISKLAEAAARAETDPLRGFSENVAVGQKIPVGKEQSD